MATLKSILHDEDTKNNLLTEFRRVYEINPKETFNVGLHEKNIKKNRYQTVLPYDSNRVILNHANDYVNASWVTVDFKEGRNHCYIATQGPMKHTVEDFWLLIWQERVTTLIMLTETVDNEGKEKCYQYWKENDIRLDSRCSGNLVVKCISVEDHQVVCRRRFIISSLSSDRQLEINQYHFKRWPDMSVPKEHEFLIFYNQLEKETSTRCGPSLIHCSAGIGRTGTFILIETMIRLVEINSHVDPLQIITSLRNKRMGMVETEEQLLFACSTVYNYFNNCNRV